MVAAAALGDVVVERRDVQQPAPLEAAHQLAAERELVRELRHGEAPQVAQHHQDVLVDGVDVEQVVLHLADDAAELGQVAAEDAVLVHAAELVHDAARLLQDVQEQQPRQPDRAEGAHRASRARATARAACARVMPRSSGCCCISRKLSRIARRLALEQVLAAALRSSSPRTWKRSLSARGAVSGRGARRACEVLQQDRVELRDRLGGAVVALHHRLAGAPRRRVRVAALARRARPGRSNTMRSSRRPAR